MVTLTRLLPTRTFTWLGCWALSLALLVGPAVSAAPPLANTCFATPDDGNTVFSSADAGAVRMALAAALPNATVKVAGYCAGVVNQGGTQQVALITQTLTIAGGYTSTDWTTYNPVANPTTLDARGGGRVINIPSMGVDATLQGFTVTNGALPNTDNWGGGIYAANNLTLTEMVVYSNSLRGVGGVHTGGGAYISGTANINQSVFRNNLATYGGGAHLRGIAHISATTFISNTAYGGDGGGAGFWGVGHITATTFVSNTAYVGGGVAFSYDGWADITASAFFSNTAYNGGGANLRGQTNITASTFASNTATYGGGVTLGGLSYDKTMTFISTTFINNTASNIGGGAYIVNPYARRLVNVLFANNRAGNGMAVYAVNANPLEFIHTTLASPTQTNGTAIYIYSSTVGLTNTLIASHTVGIWNTNGVVNENATLFAAVPTPYSGTIVSNGNSLTGTAAFYDTQAYQITARSAALDAGVDAGIGGDFFGDARPQGAGYDIGYDEAVSHTLTLTLAGTGNGLITPSVGIYTYTFGTLIPLTATPDIDAVFAGWSADGAINCTRAEVCALMLIGDRNVTATFNTLVGKLYLAWVQRP